MKTLQVLVNPNIPEPLKPLDEIAHNIWLSWNFDAVMLFIRLDYDAWIASHQNPVRTLGMVSQERFDELAQDDSYLSAVSRVYDVFKRYRDGETWYQGQRTDSVGYFSMEFGLDVSLPMYSGGLGVLSGDHMKTSSDLGLPLVGVGLLYRQGYFKQYLNADGFQQESYPENDWYNMPVRVCTDADGEEIKISVPIGESMVVARIWEARVGRNSLYLLDTNIPENAADNREITATLYGGDRETRIRQEALLGVGGIRALRALGIRLAVAHMNEGHSAFLGLERLRILMHEQGLTFPEALQAVWPTSIFTTHTPVPAGNERFSPELMAKYFRTMAQDLGLSWEEFLALGRENPADTAEPFCMTVLALRLSAYNNGVSELHGEISREMWHRIWPEVPLGEVPITHITNGVHPRTWISHNMLELMDRYFGPRFEDEPTRLEIWDRVERISNEELWRTHERRRERLVAYARQRLRDQLCRRGCTANEVAQAEDVLSPYALTISFARRFATYKRATLLLRDPERLIRLLSDSERPIQLIFAGKAHPHDMPGKDLIRKIVHFASNPEVRSRIVFLEDYDISVARYLTSGSDIWLNTPRRPLEASGTSGMKAAINGALNVSVLDGWWNEAFHPSLGWSIGHGEEYEDEELHDAVESRALYDLLEREVIPTFYTRGRDGLPREWIRRMKNSISTIGTRFSSHRMLMQYSNQVYLPALDNARRFSADGYAIAKDVAAYLERAGSLWDQIQIHDVRSVSSDTVLRVGDTLSIECVVDLGELQPDDVAVELYHGPITTRDTIGPAERTLMHDHTRDGDKHVYSIGVACTKAGRQGFAVRIVTRHPELAHPFVPGLIKWG